MRLPLRLQRQRSRQTRCTPAAFEPQLLHKSSPPRQTGCLLSPNVTARNLFPRTKSRGLRASQKRDDFPHIVHLALPLKD
jgi:hypothetical protein